MATATSVLCQFLIHLRSTSQTLIFVQRQTSEDLSTKKNV